MPTNDLKERLLNNLRTNTYCLIKPSKVNGVGVFAIRTIPSNTNPFMLSDGQGRQYDTIDLVKDDLGKVPKSIVKLLDRYFLTSDDTYPVISYGLNDMDISFYINHSDSPNIKFIENTNNDLLEFQTIKKIKSGEELLVDYSKDAELMVVYYIKTILMNLGKLKDLYKSLRSKILKYI